MARGQTVRELKAIRRMLNDHAVMYCSISTVEVVRKQGSYSGEIIGQDSECDSTKCRRQTE
jgi:hypothetical protein